MGNPKPIECAQCIQSMAHAKGELLTRIACANCQDAEVAEREKLQRKRSSRVMLISRCPECGKWCWTRTSKAIHRELHGGSRN
jgi:ssDNA-binding Zn-finger/Zn-ribbon topoisomerase 1